MFEHSIEVNYQYEQFTQSYVLLLRLLHEKRNPMGSKPLQTIAINIVLRKSSSPKILAYFRIWGIFGYYQENLVGKSINFQIISNNNKYIIL